MESEDSSSETTAPAADTIASEIVQDLVSTACQDPRLGEHKPVVGSCNGHQPQGDNFLFVE